MRIAIIVKSFPVVSETFILREITGLIDRGHEVAIYARTPPAAGEPIHSTVRSYDLLSRTTYIDPGVPPESVYWQMPVYPLTGETWLPGASAPISNMRRAIDALPALLRSMMVAPKLTMESLRESQYNGAARNLTSLYYLGALAKSRKRYDVVHIHYGPVANLFRFAGRLFDAPLVVSFHGFDFTKHPSATSPDVYNRLFGSADFITVNGTYAREQLIQLGCPPAKLAEIRYGIDPGEFTFRPRARSSGEAVRLLTVARLVPKKGLDYAIRAVAELRSKHCDVTYEIVGDGRLRPDLQALIDELHLGDVVVLSGAMDGEAVRSRMAAAHIFILPSVTADDGDQEGTPVTLMEAQAMGLPVVSTLHAGIPEVVLNGKSGFLVGERDVKALADALQFLVDHDDRWADLGRAGSDHISEHYDLRRTNDDLVKLYERARHE